MMRYILEVFQQSQQKNNEIKPLSWGSCRVSDEFCRTWMKVNITMRSRVCVLELQTHRIHHSCSNFKPMLTPPFSLACTPPFISLSHRSDVRLSSWMPIATFSPLWSIRARTFNESGIVTSRAHDSLDTRPARTFKARYRADLSRFFTIDASKKNKFTEAVAGAAKAKDNLEEQVSRFISFDSFSAAMMRVTIPICIEY